MARNATKNLLLSLRITKPKRGHPKHPGNTLLHYPAHCRAQARRSTQSPALAASGTTPCRCCSPRCGLQPVIAARPPSPTCRPHHSPPPQQHTRQRPRASRPSQGRLSAAQPICPSTDPGLPFQAVEAKVPILGLTSGHQPPEDQCTHVPGTDSWDGVVGSSKPLRPVFSNFGGIRPLEGQLKMEVSDPPQGNAGSSSLISASGDSDAFGPQATL